MIAWFAAHPPDTPKPDASLLVAGSAVFTPTAGPVPLDDIGCAQPHALLEAQG
jgi:hypothetical protein